MPKGEFVAEYIHYAYKHLFDKAPSLNFESMDIQVFLISLILLKNTDNKQLFKKWIEGFCKRFESYFLKDIYNKQIREEVFDFILKSSVPDINNKIVFAPQYVTIPIPYYLLMVSGIVGSEFKLVNQAVSNGVVSVYHQRFILLLRIRLETIIFNRLKEHYTKNDIINSYVSILKEQHPVKVYQAPSISNDNKGMLPPCIQYMITKAKEEHDLEHKERLILGIYMVKKGYPEEEIKDVYSQLSDYHPSITKKALKPLSKYQMYGCQKVEGEGCCKKEMDKTGRCSKITNPFVY